MGNKFSPWAIAWALWLGFVGGFVFGTEVGGAKMEELLAADPLPGDGVFMGQVNVPSLKILELTCGEDIEEGEWLVYKVSCEPLTTLGKTR